MKEYLEGLRLGVRYCARPQAANRALQVRRVVGAVLASTVALLAVSLWQANDDRAARGRLQEPRSALGQPASFLVSKTDAPYSGDVWTTIFMSPVAEAPPAPPGVPDFPRPGEVYVSPAVAEVITHDPLAARRVPGEVVGLIGERGLQSPDQFFVYAGVRPSANPDAWKAVGWGSPANTSERPAVPRLAFALILASLVGLPVLMLTRLTGQLSAESRRRTNALLHMLGVPTKVISLASATEALFCSVIGGVIGCIVTAIAVGALSDTTALGIAWFPPSTRVNIASAVMVIALLCCGVAFHSTRSTRKGLSQVLHARSGAPTKRSAFWLTPMLLGLAALAGVVVPYVVVGLKLSSTVTYYYFLAGTFLATLGTFAAVGPLMRGLARCLRRVNPQGPTWFLAVRRLWWDGEPIGRSLAAILLVMVSGMVGAGALADLARLSPESPAGDQFTITLSGGDGSSRALAVPASMRALRLDQGTDSTWLGTCRDLTGIIRSTNVAAATQFRRECHEGNTYRLASTPVQAEGTLAITGIDRSELGTGLVRSDPVTTYPGPLRHTELIAYPGPTETKVDDYLSRVLSHDPTASVTNTSADVYKPMIPATRRLFIISCVLGLTISVALLVLAAADSYQRNHVHVARLNVLGGTSALAGKVHVTAIALGAAVVTPLAACIGWLAGLSYDLAGGTGATPGRLGWTVTLLGLCLACAAVAIAWLNATQRPAVSPVELLHRE